VGQVKISRSINNLACYFNLISIDGALKKYIYTQISRYKIYVVKTGLFYQFLLFDMNNNLGSQNIIYKTGLYEYNTGLELGIKY